MQKISVHSMSSFIFCVLSLYLSISCYAHAVSLAEEKFLKLLSLTAKVVNLATGVEEDVPLVAPRATLTGSGKEGDEEETEEEVMYLLKQVAELESNPFEDGDKVVASALLLKIRGMIAKVRCAIITHNTS